jgi:hypothetical protein
MRRSQIDRIDALIRQVEQRRLPEHEQHPTVVYISGVLPNQQRVGIRVGRFQIFGGLPPLPYGPDADPWEVAFVRL